MFVVEFSILCIVTCLPNSHLSYIHALYLLLKICLLKKILSVISSCLVKNAMLPVSAVGFYYTVPEEFFELLQDVLKQ